MERYEQRTLLLMIFKLFQLVPEGRRRTLAKAIASHAGEFGMEFAESGKRDEWGDTAAPAKTALFKAGVKRIFALRGARTSGIHKRLQAVGRIFKLTDLEVCILGFFYRYKRYDVFEALVDEALGGSANKPQPRFFAGLFACPIARVRAALGRDGTLQQCGLLDSRYSQVEVTAQTLRALDSAETTEIGLERELLGEPLCTELAWQDFVHLKAEPDRAAALLNNALQKRKAAVHLLLYGPPGTGKSELARVLATRIGVSLHAVGEGDEDGDEQDRGQRLAAYRMAQRLSARGSARLLLVDEADDVLGSNLRSVFGPQKLKSFGSKAHVHHLLETTQTPTIWTTNTPEMIDPAVLRRMTYAIEIKAPNSDVLTQLWQRESAKRQIGLTLPQAHRLAETFPVAPSLVTGALNFAELTSGGYDDLHAGVSSIAKAMNDRSALMPKPILPAIFDVALSTSDTDLPALADRIVSSGERAVSFCLYGAPGTGKTASARYLAERLGMKLLQKRTSDLISKYIGESEQQIAAAFAEARDRDALLMFDEADSLLRDRRNAQRSWEVSQVNEMLTWMESHPLPFVCATNLMEGLDAAALRRFVFKVRFDWLDGAKIEQAFSAFFAIPAPPGLRELENLAPGDFAVVARKARVLGCLGDANQLAAMLRSELALKPGARHPLGFSNER
jgi:transitional endoplasmic reticulum ATPase